MQKSQKQSVGSSTNVKLTAETGKARKRAAAQPRITQAIRPTFEALELRQMLSASLKAGVLDTAFNATGTVTTDINGEDAGTSVAVEANGTVIVAGTSNTNFSLASYNASGGLLSTVQTPITSSTVVSSASAITLDTTGRVLVAGTATNPVTGNDFVVARYTVGSTGTLALDTTFGTAGYVTTDIGGSKRSDIANSIAIQGTNILVAGNTAPSTSPTQTRDAVVRYNSSGGLLNSFVTTGTTGESANAIVVNADGSLILAGSSGTHSETVSLPANISSAVRHTITLGATDSISAAVLVSSGNYFVTGQADGKLVVAELNADAATLTTSFSGDGIVEAGFAGTSSGNSIAVQTNGKVVSGGYTTDASTNNFFALAKFNADGSPDNTFGTSGTVATDFTGSASGSSVANGVAIEPDGKIVAAGYTAAGANPNNFAVARYVADNAPRATGNTTFTDIVQNQTAAPGNTVGSLLTGLGATDVDGDALGVAVTGATSPNGIFQYSTDGGATFTTITTASDSSALLLAKTTGAFNNLVRFKPNTGFSGSVTLSVRVWDKTQGAPLSTYDTTFSAAQNLNAFSDSTFSVTQTVVAAPASTYVNSTWAGTAQGASVTDSLGNTHTFGIDAFATVSDGVTYVASAGTVNVDGGVTTTPLTYAENVSLTRTETLKGFGQATPTLTAPTSLTNQIVVSVSAPNVTVQNLKVVVDQPYAAAGIAGIDPVGANPSVFDGLKVLNNVIVSTGAGGKLQQDASYGPTNKYSAGIAVLAGAAGSAPTVTIQGNQILPSLSGSTLTSTVGRGIWAHQVAGSFKSNTIEVVAFQDVQLSFLRGPTTFDGNTLRGTGLTITEPNSTATVDVSNNTFSPAFGVDDGMVEVRHDYNTSAPVSIHDNAFTLLSGTIGVLSVESIAVSVSHNTFTPAAGATNTIAIDVDTQTPSSSEPAPFVSDSISVQSNTFNGVAGSGNTAIYIADHDAGTASPAPDFGAIVVGGIGAAANVFTAALDHFLVLAPASASANFSGDIVAGINPAAASVNIDATGNNFGVASGHTGAGQTLADDYEIEDKITDGIDYAGGGLVRIKAANVFVTPNSFLAPATTDAGAIQRSVNLAASGDTVNVEAGTYRENLTVGKSITLSGPNAGVAGFGVMRSAEAIVEPGLTSDFNSSNVVTVGASNVTIDGFAIQGSINGTVPTGQSAGSTLEVTGTVSYAATGVGNSVDVGGLVVQNNIVKDFTQYGINADNSSHTVSVGNRIVSNSVSDIPDNGNSTGFFGQGIVAYDNLYAQIENNQLAQVRTGIQTGNYNLPATGGFVPTISNNNVSAYVKGVYLNLEYQDASTTTVANNTITQANASVSTAYNVGLIVQSIQSAVATNITGNNVSGFKYGIELAGNNSSNTATVHGGTLNANAYGVWATNNDYFYSANYNTSAVLDGVQIQNSTTAGVLIDSASPNSDGTFDTTDSVTLAMTNGTTITGGPTGLLATGSHSAIAGNTLDNTAFSGQSTFVALTSGAANGLTIDATSATFNGVTGAGTSLSGDFAIENRITDYIDKPGVGFVRIKTGEVFDTAISETTTPGSLQRAVNAAASGDVLNVQAGTYVGSSTIDAANGVTAGVIVSKPLTILGPNSGFDANGATPSSQAIILPGYSDPNPFDTNDSVVVEVTASNVTIKGITVDGSNPALAHSGGVNFDGVPIDAAEGIASYTGTSNINISNNVVQHTAYTAIDFDNYDSSGIATSNNTISNNLIRALSDAYGYGVGVLLGDNFYAQVTNNVLKNVYVGVQTGNFYNATPSSTFAAAIDDNKIEARHTGLFYNLHYSAASAFDVSRNAITALAQPAGDTVVGRLWNGILIGSQQSGVSATFTDNTIDGTGNTNAAGSSGYNFWNDPTTGSLAVSGGSVTGVQYGVWANSFEGYNSNGSTLSASVSGLTVTGGTAGIYVEDSAANTAHPNIALTVTDSTITGATTGVLVVGSHASVSLLRDAVSGASVGIADNAGTLTLGSGDTVTGGTTGVALSGLTVAVTGNTLNNLTFTGQSGDYLALTSGAAAGVTLDATAVRFDGVTGSAATLAQAYAIEDKITDYLDDGSVGYVSLNAANVYVTQKSEDTNSGAVQRGVNVATSGSTVDVAAGTFTGQVTISNPVTLTGAGASTVIQSPATLSSSFTSGGTVYKPVVTVDGTTATVENLSIDGLGQGNSNNRFVGLGFHNAGGVADNLTVTGTRNTPLDGVQAGYGIIAREDDLASRTLTVSNSSVSDYQKNGIDLRGKGLNAVITHNTVTGAGATPLIAQNGIVAGFGAFATVSGNTVSGHEYSGATSGADPLASDQSVGVLLDAAADGSSVTANSVFGNDIGIYSLGGTSSVTNNQVGPTTAQPSVAPNRYEGIVVDQGMTAVSGNQVAGGNIGVAVISFDGNTGPAAATVSNNTVTNAATGIEVLKQSASNPAATATLTNNTLTNNTTGVADISGTIATGSGNTIAGGTTGLSISGAGATLFGNTLAGLSFTGQSGDYVALTNGALAGVTVNGTVASYDGVNPSSATTAQAYAIEDKLTDYLDVPSVGYVSLSNSSVYVTQKSENTTAAAVQRGVNVAASSARVNVTAGTFTGQVTITKALTLTGAGASTVIQSPATLASLFISGGVTYKPVIMVEGSDATVQHLAIDGLGQGNTNNRFVGLGFHNAGGVADDLTVSGTRNTPLDGVQAGYGIIAREDDSVSRSLTVSNSSVSDYQKNGIDIRGAGLIATITGNTVTGAGATPAIAQNGIIAGFGAFVTVSGNTVSGNEYSGTGSGADPLTAVQSTGILLDAAASGSSANTNNAFGNDIGIYSVDGTASVNNNEVGPTAAQPGVATNRYEGIVVDEGTTTVSGNQVAGGNVGVAVLSFDGNTGPATATISGNTVTGAITGIEILKQSASDPAATASLSANTLTNNATGIAIIGGTLTIGTSNEVGGGIAGIVVARADSVITGNTLGDIAFSGQSGDYISLANGAENGTTLNGTGATYDGVLGSNATTAQGYAIDDKITDALDTSGVGYVRVKSGNVFVTSTSGAAGSIQRGIDNAVTNDTVHVESGTYHESPQVNKSVTLAGDGRSTTTIDLLPAGTAPVSYLNSIDVTGAVVTVSGFTVIGNAADSSGQANSDFYIESGVSSATLTGNTIESGAIGAGSNGDDGYGIVTEYNENASQAIGTLNVSNNNFSPAAGVSARAFYVNTGVNSFTFDSNTITGNFTNRSITEANNAVISNNTVTGTGVAGSRSGGGFGNFGDTNPALYGHASYTGNTITGVSIGISVIDASATVTGNTLSGNDTGVLAYTSDAPSSTATISGNQFTGNGIGINIDSGAGGSIAGNNFATGSADGTDVQIEAGVGSLTIGDGNAFNASTDYITNLSSRNFDLSSYTTTTFGGFNAATSPVNSLTLPSFYATEDKIVDAIDAPAFGLVRIKANNLFVTPGSFHSPETTAPSIQRAKNLSSTDTIHVEDAVSIVPVPPGSIVYGTATVPLSGTATSTYFPLSGEGQIVVTVNSVSGLSASGSIGTGGAFTATGLDTHALHVNGSPYGLTYSYQDGNVVFDASPNGSSTLAVTPKSVSAVIVGDPTKVYNATTNATLTPSNYQLSGLVNGDQFNVSKTTGNYDTKDVATANTVTTTLASGDYVAVGASQNSDYSFPTIVSGAGHITQATLTVTATGVNKIYDATANATVTLSDNRFAGDTFTDTYGSAVFVAGKNVGTGKAVAVSGIAITGADAGNYTFNTAASTTADISKAALTITAATNTKTYDGTTTAAATPTVSGLFGTDSVAGLSETYDNRNAGTGKTLSVGNTYTVNDGNTGGNYTVTTVADTTGVINKASLTITATTNTKTYDSTTTAAALPTVSGLQNTDTASGLVESYDNKNAGTGKTLSVSAYTVNDGNGGNNYTVTTVPNATGVINKAALTITAATNTKTYDGTTTAAATPTVSGLFGTDSVAGLSETYDNRNAGTGKTLSVGNTYTVNDGNTGGNYTVTTVADTTGVINKASLTITATTNTKTYDSTTTAAALPTVSGLQNTDTASGLVESYDNKNAGTGKTLSVSAYTVNDGNGGNNYTVTTVPNATGVINKASLTITATADDKVYDLTTTATAHLSDSRIAGDSFTDSYTAANFDTRNVGNNKPVTVTGINITGPDAGNYTFNTTASTTASIFARSINVSKNDFTTAEGTAFTGQTVATFTDAAGLEPVGEYTATIDWGDGTPVTAGTVTLSGGVATVKGNHGYVDNGSYAVKVQIADGGGSFGDDNASPATATVTNVAPTAALSNVPTTSPEGTAITVTGTSFDPGTADTLTYSYSVTRNGVAYSASNVGPTLNRSSTYTFTPSTNGSYVVSLFVTDKDGSVSSTTTSSINVTDVAPTVALSGSKTDAGNPTPNDAEGSTFTLTVGPVVDPGTAGGETVQNYFINWGDGTAAQSVTAAQLQASGRTVTHVYTDGTVPAGTTAANLTITVDIQDTNGFEPSAGSLGIVVYNVNPTAVFSGSASVSEGTSGTVLFLNQTDPSSVDTSAGFRYSYDFNNDNVFEVTNSSSPSASVPASFLSTPGTTTVHARIMDKDGGFTDYTRAITVTNVNPTVNALSNVTTSAGTAFSQTGGFTDPGNDNPYTVYVNYNFDPNTNNGVGTQIQSGSSRTFALGTTYNTPGTYTVRVTVVDAFGGTGTNQFTVTAAATTFQVSSFVPTGSGFDVTLNHADDTSVLNLYKGFGSTYGAADVTLVGTNTGAVRGSLTYDAATNTIHFIKTGGVLAPDTYTLTLVSANDAFRDTSGNLLDGDANGTAGGNYTATFNVGALGDVLSVPDVVRGPGQSFNLPVTLAQGAGVTAVDFDLVYDPSLLTITPPTTAQLGSAVPSGWAVTVNSSTPGHLRLTLSGTSSLPSGSVTLLNLAALIPTAAQYTAGLDLQVTNLRINENGIAGTADSGAIKVAFIGDASGNRGYSTTDSSLISNVVVGNISGFDAYPLFDPVLIGDVTGDGTLSGQDASLVAQKSVGFTVTQIPDLPAGNTLSTPVTGLDPTVTIPSNVLEHPGDTFTIPVSISDISGLLGANFSLGFNASKLQFVSATIGAADPNFAVYANADNVNGALQLGLSNNSFPAGPGSGTIAFLTFTVAGSAASGTSPVAISGSPDNAHGLNEGALPLTTVNGSINIQTASVGGQFVFYNGSSKFDVKTDASVANSADFNAIATDKSALLPGQTATFANYTSYSLGLNGILIDFVNMGSGATFSAGDFIFKVGNSNTPGTWANAPTPLSITAIVGPNGDTYADIIWANNAIQNQYLQVTVIANSHTHLSTNNVFYYGNAIGETGDSTANANVNATDTARVQNNQSGFATVGITNLYDVNRDGRVNATDTALVQSHQSGFSALKLITVPATPAPAATTVANPIIVMSINPVTSTATITPTIAPTVVPTAVIAAAPFKATGAALHRPTVKTRQGTTSKVITLGNGSAHSSSQAKSVSPFSNASITSVWDGIASLSGAKKKGA